MATNPSGGIDDICSNLVFGGESHGLLADRLDSLLDAHAPAELIAVVCDSPHDMEVAASRSYQHTNGFDKIVLWASEDRHFKLRLHIWWPGESIVHKEHIHNHRWDFATRLVAGQYQLELFSKSDSEGEPYQEYLYWSPEEESSFEVKQHSEMLLLKQFHSRVLAGSGYSMQASMLHRVSRWGAEATVSLMLQGPVQRDHTNVFTERGAVLPMKGDARRFDPSDLSRRFHAVLPIVRQGN